MDTGTFSHIAELKDISSTLHLVYHRNKNQHSNSKWWKWLSLLKRSTLKLIIEAEELDSDIDGAIESRIKARTRHFLSHVLPKCYLAFSTVTADKQFSTLGVVLIALLARISKAIPSEAEEPTFTGGVDLNTPGYRTNGYAGEDIGEIVGRREEPGISTPLLGPAISRQENKIDSFAGSRSTSELGSGPMKRAPRTQKQSKKKKKRGNEIDDIFNSLV
ncbi:hypothetical protein FQN54_001920 [Arachnomyces sp. PD_36]|nr:hypothetical protein FQN54_001920 [Arachnomyces sp. PD_36]